MKKLRPIRPGDTIAFVSPASPLIEDKLTTISLLLHEAGYKTKVMPHALDWTDHLAGTDEDRAADLMAAFLDPEVAAVICTRGGYGCARLFPYLDLDAIAEQRKAFFGFSDITTLHAALNRRGLPTIHSPMALTLHYPREPWVYHSFLRGVSGDFAVPAEAPRPKTIVPGVVEGEVIGGCLILIADSIGTPEMIDAEGKILMIEDVDEAPHRIDAMLTHLINSGVAQSAAGFLIGEMTRTDERPDESIGARPWRTIVTERLAPLGKPMAIDFPWGHAKSMLTTPFGVKARFDATEGTIEFLESPFEA